MLKLNSNIIISHQVLELRLTQPSHKLVIVRKVIFIGCGVLILGLAIASIGVFTLGWYKSKQAPQTADKKSAVSISMNSDDRINSIPLTDVNSSSKTIALSGDTPGSSNNSANPAVSPVTDSSVQNTKLDPSKFSSYEKYKASQDALYADITAGTGKVVMGGKTITINYRGWLTNGQEFDESYSKGKPFSFVTGQHKVILGLEEGMSGMKAGGRRLLVVPPAVGYGSQVTNGIPSNSVLVFEIELISVQ